MPRPSYRQLQPEERVTLAALSLQNKSLRDIAQVLWRSASTLSRERRRNVGPQGYAADAAQAQAAQRRIEQRPWPKLHPLKSLWLVLQAGLRRQWSPQQISATLRRMFPDQPDMHVSHETIYTAIYAQPAGELRRELVKCLCQAKNTRRPRNAGDDRRGQIPDMLSIHVRPPEVNERTLPGHWEGDLIKGAMNRSAVGTRRANVVPIPTREGGMPPSSAPIDAPTRGTRMQTGRAVAKYGNGSLKLETIEGWVGAG